MGEHNPCNNLCLDPVSQTMHITFKGEAKVREMKN